jgi:hypothetical protein
MVLPPACAVALESRAQPATPRPLIIRRAPREALSQMVSNWSRPFEDPIPLPDSRQLVTLKEAADYIMKLSKADRDLPEWQAAGEALIMAAEGRAAATACAR